MTHSPKTYVFVIFSFLIYSFTSIFSKGASQNDFLSLPYILFLAGAVCVLGIFALLWQQIIKKMPVSDAYMFKGSSLIFTLVLLSIIFGEPITLQNVIGAGLIIGGMTLFAKA